MTQPPNKAFKDMTLQELHNEVGYWNDVITSATSWGASLAAADEFRTDAMREIERRKAR